MEMEKVALVGIVLISLALVSLLLVPGAEIGGIVMIGPVPILIGTSKHLIIAATVMLLVLTLILIPILIQIPRRDIGEVQIPREGLTTEKHVGGGGVIMIGPIPITFGTNIRYAILAMILAIILTLLAIVLTLSAGAS